MDVTWIIIIPKHTDIPDLAVSEGILEIKQIWAKEEAVTDQ